MSGPSNLMAPREPAMERYSDYDAFAWLYSRYWAEEFHSALKTPLERALLARLKRGAAILDLCCGDGRLAALLERQGFRVTGIDGSQEMLACARQRCRRTRLILADARTFKLEPQFDAVTCMFDSLNHVMRTADLRKVFVNVWRCLKPAGLFVFDLSRREAYSDLWSRTSSTVEADVVSVGRGSFFEHKRLAVCDITLMRRVGEQWQRSDFRLRQRLHPPETVIETLRACGFSASVTDACALGMRGNMAYGRDFFTAEKPESAAKS